VGGHSAVKANVRVIAATHQDLEQRVKEGVFREDLYHRLNVIRLRLPALRERREDVPVLARYFLAAQRPAAGRGAQTHGRCCARASGSLPVSWQCAPAGKHLPLAHGDGTTQVIEVKDLPPEVLAPSASASAAPAVFTALSSGVGGGLADTPLEHRSGQPASHDRPLDANNLATPFDATAPNTAVMGWEPGLEQEALALLNAGRTDVWDALTRRFETSLIQAALATTRGRRIEAAQKLGIGRNTITRKIQELGRELDEALTLLVPGPQAKGSCSTTSLRGFATQGSTQPSAFSSAVRPGHAIS
jgi:two-component system, NtrC family, nitrogen regulation response regulator GlnG